MAIIIVIIFSFVILQQDSPSHRSKETVICIDPGHPSDVSSGAELQNGTTEVHIVWMVGLKLQKLLKTEGFKVVMTKSKEDELVKNKDRARIANEAKAALLVRLHCDSSPDSGFAIYYPDRQGTKDGITGPAEMVMQKSQQAAEAIHAEMTQALQEVLKDGGVRGDSKTLVGSKQGALTGSIFSQVPVVTIEMVVLSNKSDAEFIKVEDGQLKMARAIATGVKKFIYRR